jgi:hypothetical protein
LFPSCRDSLISASTQNGHAFTGPITHLFVAVRGASAQIEAAVLLWVVAMQWRLHFKRLIAFATNALPDGEPNINTVFPLMVNVTQVIKPEFEFADVDCSFHLSPDWLIKALHLTAPHSLGALPPL